VFITTFPKHMPLLVASSRSIPKSILDLKLPASRKIADQIGNPPSLSSAITNLIWYIVPA
jgi:hypothetical protein